MPKLGAFNCFGGQIFQTRPNFIDLGALVCDNYPSIQIPKIVKIDQQIQAQVCIPTPGSQHCKMAFWSITQEQACQCSKMLMPYLSTLCFSSPEIFTHVKRFILRAEDFISYWWPAAVLPLVVFLFSIPECDVLWSSWSYVNAIFESLW